MVFLYILLIQGILTARTHDNTHTFFVKQNICIRTFSFCYLFNSSTFSRISSLSIILDLLTNQLSECLGKAFSMYHQNRNILLLAKLESHVS